MSAGTTSSNLRGLRKRQKKRGQFLEGNRIHNLVREDEPLRSQHLQALPLRSKVCNLLKLVPLLMLCTSHYLHPQWDLLFQVTPWIHFPLLLHHVCQTVQFPELLSTDDAPKSSPVIPCCKNSTSRPPAPCGATTCSLWCYYLFQGHAFSQVAMSDQKEAM